MFENMSIFVLLNEENQRNVYKLSVDRMGQEDINNIFEESIIAQRKKYSIIDFDPSYKADDDEMMQISDFALDDKIINAIQKPNSVELFVPKDMEINDIIAVFTGTIINDKTVVAFQRFRKEQYISAGKLLLFFDKQTFVKENKFGIGISDKIDCFFDGNNLIFPSFYFARQIFDLTNYFKEATNEDIQNFINNDIFSFNEDSLEILQDAPSWARKKISSIEQSKVLEKFSAKRICEIAIEHSGINIDSDSNKILLPSDKNELKILLSFLDEEAWRGPFTNNKYISNSKRKI